MHKHYIFLIQVLFSSYKNDKMGTNPKVLRNDIFCLIFVVCGQKLKHISCEISFINFRLENLYHDSAGAEFYRHYIIYMNWYQFLNDLCVLCSNMLSYQVIYPVFRAH